MADVADLKKSRGVAKGKVTKLCNKISLLVAEDQKVSTESLDQLRSAFSEFDELHDKVVGVESDVDESVKYYQDVYDKYLMVLLKVKAVQKVDVSTTQKVDIGATQRADKSQVASALSADSDIFKLLCLPKVELQKFSGDPLKYHGFIKSFEINVVKYCSDPDQKLALLLQYTSSEAFDSISGASVIGGQAGYDFALKTLKDQFGSKYVVTEGIIRSLRKSKPVKTPSDMRAFSFEIKNALHVLENVDSLTEVDSQVMIADIVLRLPSFAQNRWHRKTIESKRDSNGYLKFNDLVDFVGVIADEMNDPVWSISARTERRKSIVSHAVSHDPDDKNALKHDKGKKKRNSNSHTHTDGKSCDNIQSLHSRDEANGQISQSSNANTQPCDTVPINCKVCKGEHSIMRCSDFKSLTVQERNAFVRKHKLCANCFRDNHTTENCTSKNRCFVCQRKHSAFLHTDTNLTSHAIDSGDCFLPVVTVLVNDKEYVRAAIDTFSSSTFCTQRLVERLRLTGPTYHYTLKTMAGSSCAESKHVSIKVSGNGETAFMSGVKVSEEIPVTAPPTDVFNQRNYPHLDGLDITTDFRESGIDLLIGQDNADCLIPFEVRKGSPSQPFAVRYKFGWALNGKLPSRDVAHTTVCNFVCASAPIVPVPDSYPIHDINRLWELENQGFDRKDLSLDDKRVVDLWDSECKVVDGHYELPIPWKDPHECLPNNVVVAEKRLHNLLGKLERQNLFERYDQEINKLLDSSYAEVVPSGEIHTTERVFYLPHHGVVNPHKPDKLRVVFDCAARFQGRSLNERCLQGPDLINNLLYVLLRFRLHHYGLLADIKEMYLQVVIPPRDRDALRFLWWYKGEIIHLRMTRHLFGGVWCASSSAYALRKAVADHPDLDPLIRDAILQSMYVDDLAHASPDKVSARKIMIGTPAVLKTAGFELTKFVVNDEVIMDEIPIKHRAKEVHEFSSKSVGKTLGLKWAIQSDAFVFTAREPPSEITRRSMLSFVASIFDPLGLISPWLLWGKLLLQQCTVLKLGWDTAAPFDIQLKWSNWVKGLAGFCDLSFPRCVKPASFNDSYSELHVFADASNDAYGACAYLRLVDKSGNISCHLLASKSHIAPVHKKMTIPRLELQAAVCAAKLYQMIDRELGLHMTPVHFWSDSMIVLGYITNETRRFSIFVSNRVAMIRSYTNVLKWCHVPGVQNPADILTRRLSTISSHVVDLWKQGPSWLMKHSCFWDVSRSVKYDVSLNDPEVKDKVQVAHVTNTTLEGSWIQRVCAYYTTFNKVIKSIAWIRRFALYKANRQCEQGDLTASEFDDAHDIVIKHMQSVSFPRELSCLKADRPILKSSTVLRLSPYLDECRILRIGGRTNHHPILVSHKHPIALSIGRHYHEKSHSSTEWLLSLVREKYWITKARRVINRTISSCITCKRLYAKPTTQIMADLPRERLDPGLPQFSHVGLDAFGPYQTKFYRGVKKRYGLVFTCFTTRAIHIEMLYSLDTESFLCAFKRFISRRGIPIKIFSDNGRNFVKGEQELRKAFRFNAKHALIHYSVPMSITWTYSTPLAPHMSGVWERQIKTLKRVFRAILPKVSHLTDETLSTFFCEVENIVNGRPLTKLSNDINDLTPLTPNTLLTMKFQADISNVPSLAEAYRKRFAATQHVANLFWSRWVKEYLPTLNVRSKWTTVQPDWQVGEMCLIQEANLPRGLWPIGLIKDVIKSSDGKVRSVIVKTRASELRRPIAKLIRLEADC